MLISHIQLNPLEEGIDVTTLDGHAGVLRDHVRPNLLQVDTDAAAVRLWLASCQTDTTRRRYAREADRLLRWCWSVQRKPLSSLLTPDYIAYQQFLQDPPESWCMPKNHKYSRRSGQWRPFTAARSESSVHQGLVVVNALLSFLTERGYLSVNPLTKAFRRPQISHHREAFFAEEQAALWQAIEDLPRKTPRQIDDYERKRWLLRLLLVTGMRLFEVASHTMGSLREHELPDGRVVWRLYIIGKGGRLDWVPVTPQLLEDLKRYRLHLGLAPYPMRGDPQDEAFPLVASIKGKRPIKPYRIYELVKAIFQEASEQLKASNPARAAKLAQAVPHLTRHTAITNVGRHADVRLTQRFARHQDINTTMLYVSHEDEALHEAVARTDQRIDD
jgi:integrase